MKSKGQMCARILPLIWLLAADMTANPARSEELLGRICNLQGRAVDPLKNSPIATVLIFASVECPISNKYLPLLQRLSNDQMARGIRVWLVFPDTSTCATTVRRHLAEHGYTGEAALDLHHDLVQLAGATITPEAAIFQNGKLLYRGRVDDRYPAPGITRPGRVQSELEPILQSLSEGRAINFRSTQAVGCYIPVKTRP